MKMRDELGVIYEDPVFAPLFPRRGQPAEKYSDGRQGRGGAQQHADAFRLRVSDGYRGTNPVRESDAVAEASVSDYNGAGFIPDRRFWWKVRPYESLLPVDTTQHPNVSAASS